MLSETALFITYYLWDFNLGWHPKDWIARERKFVSRGNFKTTDSLTLLHAYQNINNGAVVFGRLSGMQILDMILAEYYLFDLWQRTYTAKICEINHSDKLYSHDVLHRCFVGIYFTHTDKKHTILLPI